MRLDSVRDLKSVLTSTLLAPLVASVTAQRALNMAARPVADAAGLHPTIALGVARRAKNDFALAVRVQQRALQHGREVDLISKQAREIGRAHV